MDKEIITFGEIKKNLRKNFTAMKMIFFKLCKL